MPAGRLLDEKKLKRVVALLREKPHSAAELAVKAKSSKRTIWRWLKMLAEEHGKKLSRAGTGYPTRYQLGR